MIASLRRDRREVIEVGQRARLELTFAVRSGQTVLTHAYAEPPFRVGRPFAEEAGLHLIMATSAPGIFGGDDFEQVIRLEPGAHIRLTSQSSLQIHPSHSERSARLLSTYEVADGACLTCHWDPIIPFAGSRFEQSTRLALSGSARLVWSDAFMSGREGRGERWAFHTLASELRVCRDDRLEYLERFRLEPAAQPVARPWIASDCSYFGTAIASGTSQTAEQIDGLQSRLAGTPELLGAVDRLEPSLVVARLASPTGPAFHTARERVLKGLTAR